MSILYINIKTSLLCILLYKPQSLFLIPFDGVVVFHDCGKLMAGKSGNVQTGIRLLENKNNYSIINSSS